jgi:hypothetical protein
MTSEKKRAGEVTGRYEVDLRLYMSEDMFAFFSPLIGSPQP